MRSDAAGLSVEDHPSPVRATRAAWALVVAITLVGACLRIGAARGDLWLDEIWTFRLIETVRTPYDIVFALPNDNNHVLTTLWLWLVGPQAAPLIVRLPAIIFGTLCVPMAVLAFAHRGSAAMIAAATCFACDYAFVHFGSEARGYSGLVFATLAAFAAMDAMVRDGISPRRQALFAAAVALGTISHLTMVEITGVISAWGVVALADRQGWRQTFGLLVSIGLPAVAGTLPALLCLAISLTTGPLHTGFINPFSFKSFETGLSRMVGAAIGLPDVAPNTMWLAPLLGLGALCVGLCLRWTPRSRWAFYSLAIFAVPLVHIVLHLPNQQFPRFHLVVAMAIALFAIDVWETMRRRSRWFAAGIAICFLLAQAANLVVFISVGRGHFRDATARMGGAGPATFVAEPAIQAGETRAIVRWYAGPGLQPILDVTCAQMPDWLVFAIVPYEHPDEADLERPLGPAACPTRYKRDAIFPAYGLSGFSWILYRRTPGTR